MERWNKHRYQQSLWYSKSYTLTERFQLSENIRMNNILWHTIVYGACGGFTSAVQVILCQLTQKNYPEIAAAMRILCLLSLNSMFIPSMMSLIRRIDRWNNEFNRILNLCQLYKRMSNQRIHSESVTSELRTIGGRQMVFDHSKETDIYFQQLELSWKKLSVHSI